VVESWDIISKDRERYSKIRNIVRNMVRGVKGMKCELCARELPKEMFSKVWTGGNTGKSLEECSMGAQYLYFKRDNCQRYCRECSRKWKRINNIKCLGYSTKYRRGNREKIARKRVEMLLNKETEEGTVYEDRAGSEYEVDKFQNAI